MTLMGLPALGGSPDGEPLSASRPLRAAQREPHDAIEDLLAGVAALLDLLKEQVEVLVDVLAVQHALNPVHQLTARILVLGDPVEQDLDIALMCLRDGHSFLLRAEFPTVPDPGSGLARPARTVA